jgi:hypothetical protein
VCGQAAQFVRGPGFVSAAATTVASGIGALLPGAAIDDYVFEPCGYSMNGVDGAAFTTIHVTPEEGFSYASVELCGYAAAALDASAMVAQARVLPDSQRWVCQAFTKLALLYGTSDVSREQTLWSCQTRASPGLGIAQRLAASRCMMLHFVYDSQCRSTGATNGRHASLCCEEPCAFVCTHAD